MYCSNCGNDLDRADIACSECGVPAVRQECALCGSAMEAGDPDCTNCGASPCAECDTWSLPHTKFCPGCGGEFAEADQEQELAECGSCGATATENVSECSQCGAEHCDSCGEWSPEASRFCQGCGVEFFEESGEEPAQIEPPATNSFEAVVDGELQIIEVASGDAWRRLLFGTLVDHLSTSKPEPKFIAACCELLTESGIDWQVALHAAARFPDTELSRGIETEVESLMNQLDLSEADQEVISEVEEGEHSVRSPASGGGHKPTCDGRHTPRQQCNNNAKIAGAA